jgi:hypothetical protein
VLSASANQNSATSVRKTSLPSGPSVPLYPFVPYSGACASHCRFHQKSTSLRHRADFAIIIPAHHTCVCVNINGTITTWAVAAAFHWLAKSARVPFSLVSCVRCSWEAADCAALPRIILIRPHSRRTPVLTSSVQHDQYLPVAGRVKKAYKLADAV